MTALPTLGVTLGDVAGIGPEITAKTLLQHPELREISRPVVLGDAGAMRRGCEVAGLNPAAVKIIGSVDEALNDPDVIEIIQVGDELPEIPLGELSAAAGDGAYRFVVEACRLGREGQIDGIVTAPLNKAAMKAGGHSWPGHTEILAHEFGVENFSMILSAGDFYLFHLTTHQSLQSAIESCTPQRTRDVIDLAHALATALGTPDAKIGLCGINPHAGEGGLFGNEDAEQLAPAVEAARQGGINVHGPIPADALMPQAVRGKWPFVIACYHDQGHAPFKSVFGDEGVNITSGLPVVRVSVDHGTAFDIAGQGIAREGSLVIAVERAAHLSKGWGEVWKVASSGDESPAVPQEV